MDSATRMQKYEEAVREYIENDEIYDFKKVGDRYTNVVVSDPSKALEFVRLNLSRDLYDRFYAKVYPFEVCKYNSADEINETREKLIEVSKKVADRKITFLEAVEITNMRFEQYIYMLRQLSMKYRVVGMSTYIENKKYFDHVTLGFTSRDKVDIIPNRPEDNKAIEKVMRKFGLKFNSETINEAYKYAISTGLIKLNKR